MSPTSYLAAPPRTEMSSRAVQNLQAASCARCTIAVCRLSRAGRRDSAVVHRPKARRSLDPLMPARRLALAHAVHVDARRGQSPQAPTC